MGAIEAKHRPAFATKLELAVGLVRWAKGWLDFVAAPVWVVTDGAYAKTAFLKPLIGMGVVVVTGTERLPSREEMRQGALAELLLRLGLAAVGAFFLWSTPFAS